MKALKLCCFFIVVFAWNIKLQAQAIYQLPTEELVYSFTTERGDLVTLCKNKKTEILILRMGNKKEVKLQYPDSISELKPAFTYSSYHRGGGDSNEAMDLNYLYFFYKGLKYVLYETSYIKENKLNSGIKMIDISTAKITNLKGLEKTKKGSLIELRDSNSVVHGDELFD